jgi:hypothetical protein
MVLLVLTDPQNSNPWCPNLATRRVLCSHNERGAILTRVCDAHEQGLAAEGRLLETADLGGGRCGRTVARTMLACRDPDNAEKASAHRALVAEALAWYRANPGGES